MLSRFFNFCLMFCYVNVALADISTTGSASVLIDQANQRVTVFSGGTCTITATVGTYSANIDRIIVSGSGLGDLDVKVSAAANVGYIDLTGSTGTLSGLSISGTMGVINATDTSVSAISGTISTGGKTDRLISAGSASGATISIGGDCKGVSIGSGSVSGFTVGGNVVGDVALPSASSITVSGTGTHTGDISVGSDTVTSVSIAGTLAGNLSVPAAGALGMADFEDSTQPTSRRFRLKPPYVTQPALRLEWWISRTQPTLRHCECGLQYQSY